MIIFMRHITEYKTNNFTNDKDRCVISMWARGEWSDGTADVRAGVAFLDNAT